MKTLHKTTCGMQVWFVAAGVLGLLLTSPVRGAFDVSWQFSTSGSTAYILQSFSPAGSGLGTIGASNPTLTLQVGTRYQVTVPNSHPLEILAKGSGAGSDIVLLSGIDTGSWESDAGVAWQDDGNGTVTFTLTPGLYNAMSGTAGKQPGYRCGIHTTTMRGNFSVQGATLPDLLWTSLSAAPATTRPGGTVTLSRAYQVASQAVNSDFGVRYALSTNQAWGDGDDLALTPDETITATGDKAVGVHSASFNATVPGSAAQGARFVLARIDNGLTVSESDETNNTMVGNQVTVDATPPTLSSVSMASTNANTSLAKAGDKVTVTFAASEALADTPAATLASHGATVTRLADSLHWKAEYTLVAGDTDGTVAFTLNYADSAGNAGAQVTATTDSTSVLFDKTAPSAAITQAAGQADPANSAPVNFTVTFSESVTGFGNGDIVLTGSTAAGTLSATVTPPGPAAVYNVAVNGMTGSGAVVVSLPAGAVQDAVGNPSQTPTLTDHTVTYDITPPAIIAITSPAPNGTYTVDDAITITLDFSDAVTLVGGPLNVLLDTGAAVNIDPFTTANSASGVYTVAAGQSSPDLNVALITLAEGATLRDAAGNTASLALPASNLAVNKDIVINSSTAWIITIVATDADKPDVQFGIQPNATDGWDDGMDLDSPEAPNPPNPKGGIYFSNPDGVRYRRDVRAIANAATWRLKVVANDNVMVLSWDPVTLPGNRTFRLYQVTETGDPTPGTTINLRDTITLTVPPNTTQWYVIQMVKNVAFDLALHPGWNLISLPIEPLYPAVDRVLDDTPGRAGEDGAGAVRDGRRGGIVYRGPVWGWAPGLDGRYGLVQVTETRALDGYWVYVQKEVTVTVVGTPVTNTVDLAPGWNLIGPAEESPPPENAALRGRCWQWDAAQMMYKTVEGPANLDPGRGYWLFANSAVTLDLSR